MAVINLPYDVRECLCCGDYLEIGGEPCICRETPQWFQNQHGEVACELHRLEKFSVKSLKQMQRERNRLMETDPIRFPRKAADMWQEMKRHG